MMMAGDDDNELFVSRQLEPSQSRARAREPELESPETKSKVEWDQQSLGLGLIGPGTFPSCFVLERRHTPLFAARIRMDEWMMGGWVDGVKK